MELEHSESQKSVGSLVVAYSTEELVASEGAAAEQAASAGVASFAAAAAYLEEGLAAALVAYEETASVAAAYLEEGLAAALVASAETASAAPPAFVERERSAAAVWPMASH